jgi:hypothetical protein
LELGRKPNGFFGWVFRGGNDKKKQVRFADDLEGNNNNNNSNNVNNNSSDLAKDDRSVGSNGLLHNNNSNNNKQQHGGGGIDPEPQKVDPPEFAPLGGGSISTGSGHNEDAAYRPPEFGGDNDQEQARNVAYGDATTATTASTTIIDKKSTVETNNNNDGPRKRQEHG